MSGPWTEQVVPRATALVMRDAVTARWRRPVCEAATGTVLEFGFGTGPNLPHYGDEVTRVLAVEPSRVAWRHSRRARDQFGRPVELVSLDAARIDLPDASVDTVVSTWTLCTIPDLTAALEHARRLLRPGGRLHLVEHTAPEDPRAAAVARTVQPVWGRLAGGCHLDRDLPALIADAGGELSARPDTRFLSGTVTFPD